MSMTKSTSLRIVQKSHSYQECKEHMLFLAAEVGMKSHLEKAVSRADQFAVIIKIFDIYGQVPTMSWLPPKLLDMYQGNQEKAKQKGVRIILTCPNCGNSTFMELDDGSFECSVCGDVSFPEQMSSVAKPLKGGK